MNDIDNEDDSSEEYSVDESESEYSDEDSQERWDRLCDEIGRDALIEMNDPYDPNPSLSRYLGSTSSELDSEEYGFDSEEKY